MDKSARKLKQIKNNLQKFISLPDFAPKYLKNIVIDFCHVQSIHARTGCCSICYLGVGPKELKKMDGYSYGFVFGRFYNKRHKKQDSFAPKQQYFSGDVCSGCVGKVERLLKFIFKKSHAP